MDPMNNEHALRDDRYTRLVAYVLGELDSADRAGVEAEIAASPEVRAELERIQRTLGVVQAGLNAAPAPRLTEAVRPPASRVWWQGKGLAAAATVTVLVGGASWMYLQRTDTAVSEERVAQAEDALTAGAESTVAYGLREQAAAANTKPEEAVPEQTTLALRRSLQQAEPAARPGDASGAVPGTGGLVAVDSGPPGMPPMEQKPGNSADEKTKKRAGPSGEAKLSYGARAVGGKAGALKQEAPRKLDAFGLAPSAAPVAGGAGGPSSAGPSSAGPAGPALGLPALGERAVVLADDPSIETLQKEDRSGEDQLAREQAESAPRTWLQLSPEERSALLEAEFQRVRGGCLPMPQELPRDMYFRFWGDNAFEATYLDRQSTFGVDVDTASYALARRYVTEGKLPQKAQIRTEEFVNYFKSDVPPPMAGPFAMHMDLAPSRFSDDPSRQMLRVVVRAKDLSVFERKPLRLTFVLDVSGSMREQNRLETVKNALRLLVGQLGAGDQVAIIKFSAEAAQVVPMTSATEKLAFEQAIQPLQPEGGTNSNAGLQLGYATAIAGYDAACVNRVVFLSDGVPTVGETDINKIIAGVQPLKEKGIYLNTVGVGMNNHNDTLLEQLADKGDGICNYIDNPKEAQRALVDNFTGAFQPVGRDVKVQVEFDPQQVLRWRQVGYENRAIADIDFRNDTVDAGEIGAGHQVTALYELELARTDRTEPLAVVRLRWKDPNKSASSATGDKAQEVEAVVHAAARTGFEAAGHGYRRAVMVAQYAEFLRRSTHAANDRVDDLLEEAKRLQQELRQDAEWNEFVSLVEKAKALGLGTPEPCDEMCTLEAQLRRVYWRHYERERLKDAGHPHAADTYDADITKLEAELRLVLEARLATQK